MPETASQVGSELKRGILVANLGTPETPQASSVARFLREFLSDPRVVDLPRWLWLPLLYLVIVPLRSRRSAAAYRSIWWEEGSPLLVLSLRLVEKLKQRLRADATVIAGMRYGKPSIAVALEELRDGGAEELLVLPLYPQFSGTTTASIFDSVNASLRALNWQPKLVCIEDYYRHAGWISAVAESIRAFRMEHGEADKLVFSMHGIPQRYVQKGDPYEQQCRESVSAIAHAAGLSDEQWMLSYQSRVGREPWLQPYTDKSLEALAKTGVEHVQVICPGFAVDCLETLEEIAVENRELFEEAGGKKLEYIPALNDSDAHVEALVSLVESQAT